MFESTKITDSHPARQHLDHEFKAGRQIQARQSNLSMEQIMSNQVSWMLELEIREGHEADLSTLIAEMVEATQANEPGTLDYEWSISADGKHCHIFERYVDSAALLIHGETFRREFAARYLEILKPVRMVVYGSPSAAVKDALADFKPVYMQFAGGFSR